MPGSNSNREYSTYIPHNSFGLFGDFKLGAKQSRQAVGGAFNPEKFKHLLGGLGDFVVERA